MTPDLDAIAQRVERATFYGQRAYVVSNDVPPAVTEVWKHAIPDLTALLAYIRQLQAVVEAARKAAEDSDEIDHTEGGTLAVCAVSTMRALQAALTPLTQEPTHGP